MGLRLVKNQEQGREHTILQDAEVERIIPLFRKGEPFHIDMWTLGVDPKNEAQVFDYLSEVNISTAVGRLEVHELRSLAKLIVAGAGF